MRTMEDIKRLKYDMLTASNVSRGYSNIQAVNEVERVEGELKKLEEAYSNVIISDDLKDEYILSELNKLVWNVDDSELDELLEGRPDDSYFNDASMTWIYDYVYNVFDDCETLDDIDCRITSMFGYYGNYHIVKNSDQFYILLEW